MAKPPKKTTKKKTTKAKAKKPPKLSVVDGGKTKVAKSRKQGQLKGFEEKEIPELTDASEVYQKTIRERLAIQSTESDQKAHLMSVVRRLLDDGVLKLNPGIPDRGEQVVYRYTDDAGEKREVCVTRADMKIKVKLVKKKKGEE